MVQYVNMKPPLQKEEKRLDNTPAPWYNGVMKYALAFCLGIITHAYIFPSKPTVEMSDMDIEEISWILLDKLEESGYTIVQAKANITQPKRGWFSN